MGNSGCNNFCDNIPESFRDRFKEPQESDGQPQQ
jgi:hypothetical protein